MDKCILMRFARDIDIFKPKDFNYLHQVNVGGKLIFKNEIYSLVVESIPFALIGCST